MRYKSNKNQSTQNPLSRDLENVIRTVIFNGSCDFNVNG